MKEIYVDGYDTVVEFQDETPDAEIQKALASNFPETDDQFVNRIADPATPASAVSFDDFKRYQELKPDLSWGDLGNLVVQGAGVAAGELFNGVKSTANLAAQGKLGTLGASVAEGAARGTYDLTNLGKRITDNVATMLEPYMQESGDAEKDQYNRFLAIKEMDNVREAARKGDSTILERFGIGVDPSMVDTESAEGFSYFLDPTVIGTGGSGKLASMLTRAGAKPAELAGRAAGGLARGISRAESKAAELLKSGTAKVDEMTGGLGKYAIPGSVGAAAYGAGLAPTGFAAAAAIGAVPALELAEGLFKGFSNSMLNNPTRIGPMRHLAMTAPATRAGKAAGWLKWMDTPLDLAAKGTTGAVIGSAYGAGLGGLAAGLEGAAQGLGAGSVLGAGTAGTMRLAEGVTGRAKVRAEENDYNTWRLTQDKDTQDFLDTKLKTHKDRVQVMDAIQLAQAGVGDQATIRVLNGDDFNAQFPGADGVQVIEGDTPVAYINGRNGDTRVLLHEVFHTMARLDGFDELVANISSEIGKMYSPDDVNALVREYESLGKPLRESEGLITSGDKFAALAEEIGAEYFANYIRGKDSSYLLKGTPFKDALNSITSKFVAGKLDRVYGSFKSEIFKHTHLKQSKGMDRAMNDLIKARRKAYRDVELSADDAIRAYGERDLGNDQVFKELQALGVAGIDNKGRRVMKTNYAIKKDDTALGKEVSDALSQADPTGGMLKNADGSWSGRNFSPAQVEALLNAPGLSDKVKEVIQFIDTIRQAGSDAVNVTYAAATYKTKRGKTRYKNLPISNRDALIYGIEVSPVGTMVARILDLSLLRSKIVRNWTTDTRLQRVFGSEDSMYQDALTYINALGGDIPTATVLGSPEKRNLLNKLLGVRNVKGNPEVPEGLFVKEGDHPWRSFRLDRFVKARPLETQAQFSQQAYEKGQINFSPAVQKQIETPAFQNWFKDSTVKNPDGTPKVVYSGHSNVEMFGNKWESKKATSGGFYFSEDPNIASNYAMGKFGNYEGYENGEAYRLLDKKGNPTKRLYSRELTPSEQKKASDFILEHAGFDVEKYWKENARYDDQAKRALYSGGMRRLDNIHGFLEAMGETIAYDKHDPSGQLPVAFKQTKNTFEKMLDHLGIKWNSHLRSQPGVYPVFLSIQKPVDAAQAFPQEVLADLKKAASRERVPEWKKNANTQWTKDMPLAEFVEKIESGDEYWTTQVPTKAKKIFQQHGYDGIKELGMKGEEDGVRRQVNWVAFEPTQIKSATGNKGTFDPLKADIRFSPTRQLNNRGGAVYNSPTGHRAVQTSSRAGVRVYDSAGKRVGPVFQSVEKAQDWLAKRQ